MKLTSQGSMVAANSLIHSVLYSSCMDKTIGTKKGRRTDPAAPNTLHHMYPTVVNLSNAV